MIGKGRIVDRMDRMDGMGAGAEWTGCTGFAGLPEWKRGGDWVALSALGAFCWGEFLGRRKGRFAPGWVWGAPLVLGRASGGEGIHRMTGWT